MFDLIIIGGGAAGLMAAIFAGRSLQQQGRKVEHGVLLLDGARSLGAKILVAGGGRCNVTHDVVHPHDYVTSQGIVTQRHAVAKVLRTFTVTQTTAFFRDIGVELKREATGKLFPTTDDARSVLDALISATQQAGVTIRTSHRVTAITHHDDHFQLTVNDTSLGTTETFTARRIVLATGGQSLPKTGSDGWGYQLARQLGHSVITPHPSLVPLVLRSGHWLTGLSGLSLPVTLAVAQASGKVLVRHTGSMLCTHFGISGPVVLDVSRHWVAAHPVDAETTLRCALLPDKSFAEVEQWLIDQAAQHPQKMLVNVLRSMLPQRLAEALPICELNLPPGLVMGQLPREARRKLVHALVDLVLPVERDRGWLFAEVTAGGVPLDEVNLRSMESKVCEGLYLCGEILDVDGRMGGYNFQWAWSTGRLAGLGSTDIHPS